MTRAENDDLKEVQREANTYEGYTPTHCQDKKQAFLRWIHHRTWAKILL